MFVFPHGKTMDRFNGNTSYCIFIFATISMEFRTFSLKFKKTKLFLSTLQRLAQEKSRHQCSYI